MTETLVEKADARDFDHLFRLELFWGAPDHTPVVIQLSSGDQLTATNVASYKGVRVWEVPTLLKSADEAAVDHVIAKNSTNRLVIFDGADRQIWRWPSRTTKSSGVISRPARHVHRAGAEDPSFQLKLEALRLPNDRMLDANEVLSRVGAAFDVETKSETKRASQLMARMYAAVEKGYPPRTDPKRRDHEISMTLARVLFLLFGDDTEMWKDRTGEPVPDLFQDFIKDHTERDGADIAERLNELFDALNSVPEARGSFAPEFTAFPYINGGLFAEHVTLPRLDQDFRDAVLAASAVDWSTISPAIFGSMFQSVRDAQTRRELGEHYTSEENILKTLNPLFLDDLRGELETIVNSTQAAGAKRRRLDVLWTRLGALQFLDPACGCGNFIIVAYRELRALELRIMETLANLAVGEHARAFEYDWTPMLRVTLDHFYGIEIDEWPARIAETAMFLIDRQCDLRMKERFGVAPERLPISKSARIRVGSALAFPWSELLQASEDVVVAGNPPFLGISARSEEQTAQLQAVWGTRYHGTLDFVTGWHACAMRFFGPASGRWAFVTTSSITHGEAVAPLFRALLDEDWQIQFAHRTFKWTSEVSGQAAVHCVIIGFNRNPNRKRLFDYPTVESAPVEVDGVRNITPYLTDGRTVIVDPANRPLNPQMGEVLYGNKPTDDGWLLMKPDEAAEAREDPIAAPFIRRFVGAKELLHGIERYCLWLVDSTSDQRAKSPVIRERVAGRKAFLLKSKAPSTRAFANQAHLFRQIAQPSAPYLCIPAHVSESRRYYLAARFAENVITSNANFLSEDADGFVFAVISTTMFIVWQRTVGGHIKSDLRFNKLLTWNTFPLPKLTTEERSAAIHAGAQVLSARAALGDVALADMYPAGGLEPELQAAHDALDETVDRTFGIVAGASATELERQDILFSRYEKLAGKL